MNMKVENIVKGNAARTAVAVENFAIVEDDQGLLELHIFVTIVSFELLNDFHHFRSSSTPPRKRRHRSRSPPSRYHRSPSPPVRRTHTRSPSPDVLKTVVPKSKVNINDTSLFAEIVKHKHKRDKVLKEILQSSDAHLITVPDGKTGSNNIVVDMTDGQAPPIPTSMKPIQSNGDLTDIPIPPSSNGVQHLSVLPITAAASSLSIAQQNCPSIVVEPPPPPPSEELSSVITPARKSKLMDMAMPPGVEVPSEVKTPSPPHGSPIAGSSKKARMKVLDMPLPPVTRMPVVVPGTEDLSDDENDILLARKQNNKVIARGNGTARAQRPEIINRRLSHGPSVDWGERCVDVFTIIDQIGEGIMSSRTKDFVLQLPIKKKSSLFQEHTDKCIKLAISTLRS